MYAKPPDGYISLLARKVSSTRVVAHIMKNVMIRPLQSSAWSWIDNRLRGRHRPVFSWPGMGKLIIDSINSLDRPVIVAYLNVIVLLFTLINLR